MDRMKKEKKRKYDVARKGLSADEVKAVVLEDELKRKVDELARAIHVEKFSEEYDFNYDSIDDAQRRNRGINPMSPEYIEKIKKKRAELGINQLAENGMSVSKDSFHLCLEEARMEIFSDINLRRPPAETCVFCNKTIKNIGGNRIVAQQLRGVTLTRTKQGGGNREYPHQCLVLFSEPLVYMDYWGEKEKWTESAVLSAKNAYLNGKQPWFCQICGERKCSKCGSPINYPVGSEILYADGRISHAAVFPFDPGCINADCENYKDWAKEQIMP